MSNSVWVRNEYCHKCGEIQDRSGNNLGVFSDGHKWCWACGHWEPGTNVVSLADIRKFKQEQQEGESGKDGTTVVLPSDCTNNLPEIARKWLWKYDITVDETYRHKIQWSPSHHRLIFPVFDDVGDVLMWQGRYFPDESAPIAVKKPRYYTRGNPDSVDAYFGHIESTRREVVVVEDFISAIKVSRICPALCLWGSQFSLSRMRRMAIGYETLFIWLDYDKAHHAARCSIKAQPYFTCVSMICTPKDPKEHSTQDIRKWTTLKD